MDYETRPLDEKEEEQIEAKIGEYADRMAPYDPHTEEERIVFKVLAEQGDLVAGCIVNVHAWGRAVLATLWVDEQYRHNGIGSMLIAAAEKTAREKGCYYLCLGTVDYMARPLYEKHGFVVFTTNKDVPKGHDSWSLCKRLDKDTPAYIPQNHAAAARYSVEVGDKQDADVIRAGLDNYCKQHVQEKHDYISLGKKLVDENGNTIAAVIAGVDGDDNAYVDGIWVDDAYRHRGLGSLLLGEVERDAKRLGAYIMLTYACDWVADFFFANGYTARGTLEDYPKGHRAYELEKRL